ncbi:unnamed protein product [Ectocarpus fasciculatus]
MLEKMKRLLREKYTAYTATAVADPTTGKLKPPGRGIVSTWCKEAWAAITPDMVKTCFKSAGLRLRSTAAKTTAGACTTPVRVTASCSKSSASSGRKHTPAFRCPRSSYQRYLTASRSAPTPSRLQRRRFKDVCYLPPMERRAIAMWSCWI